MDIVPEEDNHSLAITKYMLIVILPAFGIRPYVRSSGAMKRHVMQRSCNLIVTTAANRSIPYRLRIPEELPRINLRLDTQQALISRRVEIGRMRLLRRQARIHIIAVPGKRSPRLGIRNGITQPLNEWDNARGEGSGGVARVSVMLHDPEGGAVAVCAEGGRLSVDLAVGPSVEVDD